MPSASELVISALEYLDQKQPVLAKELLLKAAEENDDAAYFALLFFYRKIEKNEELADFYATKLSKLSNRAPDQKLHQIKLFQWIQNASDSGVISQYLLGVMYFRGLGTNQDYQKAYELLLPCAEQGYARAQSYLGDMYRRGLVGLTPPEGAVEWYRKAAEQGLAQAQYNVGVLYLLGQQGVIKNEETAATWFLKAAEQGHAEAQYQLGRICDNGIQVNQANAATWYRKAADQEHAGAQNNLGIMYKNGHGVDKNQETAIELFNKSAQQGFATAQYNMGLIYQRGEGVVKNLAVAFSWFFRSGLQNNSPALKSLATFLSPKSNPIPQPAPVQELKQQIEEITQNLLSDFGLLMGMHKYAAQFSDTLFLLPEYSEFYEFILERLKKYQEVLACLESAPSIMVTNYELNPNHRNTEFFPDSQVNYPPQKPGISFIRYYPKLDTWAFGEQSVAASDKIAALMSTLKTEQELLALNHLAVKIVPGFETYLMNRRNDAMDLGTEILPPEVNINEAFEAAKLAFIAQQQIRSHLPTSPKTISEKVQAQREQQKAHKLGVKAQFLAELMQAEVETATAEEMQQYFVEFSERIDAEENSAQQYQDLEKLLGDLLNIKITESNAKLKL